MPASRASGPGSPWPIWAPGTARCVFLRRTAFFEAGMENEHFRAWGLEDDERVVRFTHLGLKVERVSGPLFHLEHPRPLDQVGPGNPCYQANDQEYQKVIRMNPGELRAYIATWPWLAETHQ